jgi:hypothetical protein
VERKKVQIGLLIDEKLDRLIELYARARGTTKTHIITRAIYEYLYRRGLLVREEGGSYEVIPDAMERLARRVAAMR